MSQAFYQNYKLGILGGGQLGKMLIQSAMDYNVDISILDPDANAPCKNIAAEFNIGKLTDFDTVYEFGKECDLVTIEIENVNTQALKKLREEGVKVFPQPEVIELIQDKRLQKQFYKENDIPTSPFILTDTKEDVLSNADFLPAVNKLGKEGYDGRGVQIIRTESDLSKAFEAPSLLEKLVDFETEISVIVARSEKGEVRTFPSVELSYHPVHNLVEFLFAPSTISEEIEKKAQDLAIDVITKLDMVGLLAVEMFVTKSGEVLVNEVAPRPHNSGHQTIEANFTSQYEQHLRAILDMPLGDTQALIPSIMVNLLGEDGYQGLAEYEGLDEVLSISGVNVHLYGKKITKPFRKMGHVTLVGHDTATLKENARFVKENLKIVSK
ncbi:5-(carboxyamino)imidazole ribonucleotide synthase [Aureibacter tunicatorum]|uniref:N5-carboxyaminoimidazole ribonucleotide synthase n=1 Tax=Aureibacter tunicatorum TaxID=866807 RepID=A0AAE4BP04_9BACT|nr:5-(carboxyamino)imidazole ribonucleotide synthase [Aureibacter tunicatorum]MDR6237399.1 5-(carboxyamino)imidazole ribonucleotide synthase [Aureibacter tunicatorum]BDD06389.1 N5-carboxyaminoimidazole ribonucleotide synthase [Aureibacter tunicatorum]